MGLLLASRHPWNIIDVNRKIIRSEREGGEEGTGRSASSDAKRGKRDRETRAQPIGSQCRFAWWLTRRGLKHFNFPFLYFATLLQIFLTHPARVNLIECFLMTLIKDPQSRHMWVFPRPEALQRFKTWELGCSRVRSPWHMIACIRNISTCRNRSKRRSTCLTNFYTVIHMMEVIALLAIIFKLDDEASCLPTWTYLKHHLPQSAIDALLRCWTPHSWISRTRDLQLLRSSSFLGLLQHRLMGRRRQPNPYPKCSLSVTRRGDSVPKYISSHGLALMELLWAAPQVPFKGSESTNVGLFSIKVW
jgi:hypothetical protein